MPSIRPWSSQGLPAVTGSVPQMQQSNVFKYINGFPYGSDTYPSHPPPVPVPEEEKGPPRTGGIRPPKPTITGGVQPARLVPQSGGTAQFASSSPFNPGGGFSYKDVLDSILQRLGVE